MGVTALHVALTTLKTKRLEGIPVAQKIADKKFRYFDSDGKIIGAGSLDSS